MSNEREYIDHRVFGDVPTRRGDAYRVTYGRYDGRNAVQLRLFQQHRETNSGLLLPSKYGVLIFPDLLPAVLDHLEEAEDYLIAEGIIKDGHKPKV